jgi:hypothetical protein
LIAGRSTMRENDDRTVGASGAPTVDHLFVQ